MRSPVSLSSSRSQRGAVAVVFGLTVLLAVGFVGLALDLGRTYIARTELQNAADAAALAGAKELNQTATGVANGIARARAIAAQNTYDFGTPVAVPEGSIWVGSCPDDGSCVMVLANTIHDDASARGMTFMRVQADSGELATFFMRVPIWGPGSGFASTTTFGNAVAGRYVNDVTPLGVCAIDPDHRTARALTGELLEHGFRRGMAYNVIGLNPLGGASGTPFLINPVDVPPGGCSPGHSSANFTAPFVCQGNSAVAANLPGEVYVNTGFSAGPVERALNSRFDDFPGGTACDPATAPPDANVHPYTANAPAGQTGHPRDWMQEGAATLPSQQSVSLTASEPHVPNPADFSQYGALWSYTHAVRAAGTGTATDPYRAGTPFEPTNASWASLYNGGAATYGGHDLLDTGAYPSAAAPSFPAGTAAAPYNQAGGTYVTPPSPAHPGQRNRRVLNLVIVDCRGLTGGGLSCARLPALAVGKFFMQTPADLSGGTKRIDGEFAGLIQPVPSSDIRLYR